MPWSDGVRRIPVRTRIVAAFMLASVTVSSVLALATWSLTTGYMLDQRMDSVVRQASVNARLVDAALARDPERLADLITGLAASPEAAIFVRQDDSWISSGTAADGIGADDLPTQLVSVASRGDTARQRLRVGGIPVVVVAMSLPQAQVEFLEVFPLRDLDRAFRFVSLLLVGGIAASGLLGGYLGRWTARRALQPLTELTEAAGRVARGDLGTRLPARADPDLGPIAAAFNETTADLQARVERDARFASDVSHELRSPVTTMAAAVEVLCRRRQELSPPARQAVDLLDGDLRRFRRLVEDLLEISRVDQGAVRLSAEPLDLSELTAAALARSHPDVRFDSTGRCPVVADRRRLEQVVVNLIENADRHGRGLVRVATSVRDGTVRLEVDDAGLGVPAADRERVFERFARVSGGDRRGDENGTGLGLALVAQHVRLHGGQVEVVERPGGGARFVVELPAGETR